jgi:hypothetical protein
MEMRICRGRPRREWRTVRRGRGGTRSKVGRENGENWRFLKLQLKMLERPYYVIFADPVYFILKRSNICPLLQIGQLRTFRKPVDLSARLRLGRVLRQACTLVEKFISNSELIEFGQNEP